MCKQVLTPVGANKFTTVKILTPMTIADNVEAFSILVGGKVEGGQADMKLAGSQDGH